MNNLTNYLHDHLGGSVSAIEMLDHLIETRQEKPLCAFLVTLRRDIYEDQQVLQDLVHQLGEKESLMKNAGAWVAEKLSRAKLDVEDDDLALLQSLEGLGLGITGKRQLWRTLATAAPIAPELRSVIMCD